MDEIKVKEHTKKKKKVKEKKDRGRLKKQLHLLEF